MKRWKTLMDYWRRRHQEALLPLQTIDFHLERIAGEAGQVRDRLARARPEGDPEMILLCLDFRQRCEEALHRLEAQRAEFLEARAIAQERVREAATQHRRLEILEEREQARRTALELQAQAKALDEWGLRRRA